MAAQIVTLLFTDLVGSSALLGELGEDAADDARRMHFSLLREEVAGAGGEEVKNLGDGLMVVFPSAVGAVRCAISMQQAIERHNARATTVRLGVRVGLHVGEPIQDEDDYFGTPVVVAKRLCDSATAGQILASGLVRGLVASRAGFTFRSVGELILKGMSEPIDGFEVVWASPSSRESSEPGTDARRLQLVGREDELNQLEDELALAGDLRGVVSALEGFIPPTARSFTKSSARASSASSARRRAGEAGSQEGRSRHRGRPF